MIDNLYANQLLLDVRNKKRISEFMSIIAGVENYTLTGSKQGLVLSPYMKEIRPSQFMLTKPDLVSEFWEAVFKYIPKTKLYGDGEEFSKNNPVHYLRMQGQKGVRNYINAQYRKYIRKVCPLCNHEAALNTNMKCSRCTTQMIQQPNFVPTIEDNIPSVDKISSYEDAEFSYQMQQLLQEFADNVLKPGTHAYTIFKLLTTKNMFSEDDSEYFDFQINKNYCVAIGNYLGVNKTFVAAKIKRIRKAAIEFFDAHPSDVAGRLSELIEQSNIVV